MPVSFPDQPQDKYPSASIGTISKIRSMKANGMKVADIANELHISPQTVRYYTKENDA